MRAANFSRVHVAVSILLECAIVLAKDESGKNDSLITAGAGFQVRDVLFGVRCVANDQQAISGTDFFEGFDYEVRVVYGFESGDVEHVPVRLNAPLSH